MIDATNQNKALTRRFEDIKMSEDRLTRMEDKIDKLSEAVLAIARMEERMLTVFKWLENVNCDLKKMDDHIDEMEKQALDDQGYPWG